MLNFSLKSFFRRGRLLLPVILYLISFANNTHAETLCEKYSGYEVSPNSSNPTRIYTVTESAPMKISDMLPGVTVVSDKNFLIENDLIIDQPIYFLRCKFKFKNRSGIVIGKPLQSPLDYSQTISVVYEYCSFFSCDVKWRGMEMIRGCYSLIMNYNHMEDAENGVYLKDVTFYVPPPGWPLPKPTIRPVNLAFTENTFNRNYNAIKIDKGTINLPRFNGNIFINDAPALSDNIADTINDAFGGLILTCNSGAAVYIGGNAPGATPNVFDNMRVGIHARGVNLIVMNTVFQNIVKRLRDVPGYDTVATGMLVQGGTLSFTGRGTITDPAYTISNTTQATFFNCYNGMILEGCRSRITNTHFQNCRDLAIWVKHNTKGVPYVTTTIIDRNSFITSAAPVGGSTTYNIYPINQILINTSAPTNHFRITNNTIEKVNFMLNRRPGLALVRSISSTDVSGFADLISYNSIEMNNVDCNGIHAEGLQYGGSIWNNSVTSTTNNGGSSWGIAGIKGESYSPYTIKYNWVGGNGMACGIHLNSFINTRSCTDTVGSRGQSFHLIGFCDPARIHSQRLESSDVGMRFTRLYDTQGNGIDAQSGINDRTSNLFIGAYPNQSAYNGSVSTQNARFVVNPSLPARIPLTQTPSDWFSPTDSINEFACDTIIPNFDGAYIDAARGFDTDTNPATLFDKQMTLYKWILRDSTLRSIPAFDSFYILKATTNLGKLAKVYVDMAGILAYDAYQTQVNTLNATRDSLVQTVINLDSLEYVAALSAGQLIQRLQADSLLQVIAITLDSLYELYLTARYSSLNTQLSLINAITPAYAYDSTYHTVYKTMIRYYMSETIDTIDRTILDELEPIASLGQPTYGAGVNIACSLIGKDVSADIILRDTIYCTTHELSGRQIHNDIVEQATTLSCYPNPAGNTVTIVGLNETGIIDIYDIAGRLQYRTDVVENIHRITVPVSDWAKGIYLVKYRGVNTITTTKFIK